MADLQFPEGIKAFKPHENAPSYVLSRVVIHVEEFANWLNENAGRFQDANGKVKLDLKLSKKNTHYLSINTYVKPAETKPDDNYNNGAPF